MSIPKTVLIVAALSILMAAFILQPPHVQAKTVIKVATIAPKGTPWMAHLEKWRKNLLAATGGDIEIKVFPGGQLGTELDTLKMVMRGRLSAAAVAGAPLSEMFPQFSLMSTPFLFDRVETIDCIYDGKLGEVFAGLLAKKNLKKIQWQETGWVYIYAKDDLSDPKTAKGYKIRVAPHPMSRILWSSVGANGIELPYIETPSALQTGMVRGGESAAISYFAFGLAKVAPHLMLTREFHQAGALVMNLKQWNRFSKQQQKAIMEALPDVKAMRAQLRGLSRKLIEKYKAGGGPVHELTPEQRAAWKKLVEPNWPKFVKALGPGAEKMWPRLLEAKKACSSK